MTKQVANKAAISDSQERPLVTFALFAYNQERFIREAVESALAQDYSPLEIILSDDYSSDHTYDIICETASRYQGSHTIRLNRNNKNLGIAAHLNALMEMVTADFVVVGAGDDVSEINRTSVLVKAWIDSGRRALSIHSSARDMDENGVLTGRLRKGCSDGALADLRGHASQNLWVLGATHAWDMSLIRRFDPILPSVINEDVVLPARAALLGTVRFVDMPLVRYRQGVGVSHEVVRRRMAGSFDLSIPLLKRPYYSFLQKYRDYREMGILADHREKFARARASIIYPIWLRQGRVTPARIRYFTRRCSALNLAWEFMKYKFPGLVALKQRVQFRLASSAGSSSDAEGPVSPR
jgi:glycosyltransferase involved in cell wall biosynthesis